jgi:hypothetical protein
MNRATMAEPMNTIAPVRKQVVIEASQEHVFNVFTRDIDKWRPRAQRQYDPDFVTEVEVTSTAEGPRKTRVDLEHRNLARYGVAAGGLRKGIDAPSGWGLILSNFARVAGE